MCQTSEIWHTVPIRNLAEFQTCTRLRNERLGFDSRKGHEFCSVRRRIHIGSEARLVPYPMGI